jgi:dynein heavy chain
MKCLFEVNDLSAASPATVSRIGVVYMTPSDLGWMPYVLSWLVRKIPKECAPWVSERLVNLFEKAFAKGLIFQRKFCKEPVETVDIQLVISLCTLFESLFTIANGVKMEAPQGELQGLLDKLFFFSYIWSVGGSCSSNYWEAFNEVRVLSLSLFLSLSLHLSFSRLS